MNAALLLAVSAVASSPADPLLARLESAAFLEADFVQSDFWALTRETETSSGHLSLAFPDMFRFEYTSPSPRETGFDGTTLYTVEHSSRQVIVNSEGSCCGFMSFLDHARDESLVASSGVTGDMVTVRLEGDLGEGISEMEMRFTAGDSLPVSLSTTDVNGNSTTWYLSGVTISRLCPPGAFSLTVPPGYETIRPGGP
ncbi:outer membrane lipoprotein carrier protein LolA [Candidatus Fermentibacteria bacterium]|nr:outer membrane lipoprotein carrier protein LolA [Candidatus Fermentibacteria bacterium]